MAQLTFVLDGRDQLSRVLDGAGNAADRFGRRLLAASINGDAAMRRLGDRATSSMAGLQRDSDAGAKAVEALKKSVISLAPAAIPAVSAMAPLAAGTGAVAVAAIAFTAALVPQIGALSEAAEAEKKYDEAVEKSGRTSQDAITAQVEYQRAVAKLPPETRKAAASLGVLKDTYKDWSNGLAGDTMAPVTKGFAILNALLPKTTGLVKGTGRELDRTVTIIGGAMASPGFDRVTAKFEKFATGTLQRVNDGLVNLMRTGDAGKVGAGATEFMDFARAQGPVVADTLRNVAMALMNILQAGADAGVGMLQIINGLSSIVAAVPPGAIAALLQLAIAIKAVRLAAVGFGAARVAMAAFGVQLLAMQTAAAGAPGRLGAVTAAIGAMSRGAKLALAGTGIGLLVIAISELASMGRSAPPDVDRLTSSLSSLADTGKVSGEAARLFGSDLNGLFDSVRSLTDPSTADKVQQFLVGWSGFDSTPVKEAKQNFDAIDDSLTSMVQGGQSDLAAAALERLKAGYREGGGDVANFTSKLDGYKQALADQAFEQKLAADAMGLFGAQAQSVQAKLDAQKASTDGLRQSIMALNEVNRAALDGRAGMEASIDAAAKATKDHASALRMSNGELNLNSEKARAASTVLTDLARKTEENVSSARNSGKSWDYAKGQYERGRTALIRSADAMGLTRSEAVQLAGQILKTPNKTAYLKGNLSDLQDKLADAKGRLSRVPDSRKAQVRADIANLQSAIAAAKRAIASVQGKTVTVRTHYVVTGNTARQPGSAGSQLKYASGGLVGFPGGGPVRGPGTGTSDSILAMVSNGEYVVKAQSVAKYGVRFLQAINEGRLGMAAALGSGGGSMGGAGREVGRGLSAGMASSTAGVESAARSMAGAVITGIRAELEIASPSKKTRALAADAGRGMLIGLTGSKARIRATARDLVKDIWAAWKGTRSTKDSTLVRMVNQDTAKLQWLAWRRDILASKIAAANKYAKDITGQAREGAKLGNLGLDAEEVTAGSIKGGLAAKLQKIKTFTGYINTLGKKGLSRTLLRQILDMGPEQGYAYASALAGASKATIKSINSTQSQIDKASTTLGRDGADRLYDSGKNAGKGFLKGLEGEQKKIEDLMMKIAKGMQKAIRKALGINSPARNLIPDGVNTVRGLALGVVEGAPYLDRALGVITDRAASTRPVIGRPAITAGAGSAGGGIHYHMQVDVHAAMDPVAVGRELQRVLVSFGRRQGATVNLNVGR
ncbi:hypothetical protein [Streptomyces enissocaesilis]|uniref:hypothetical protein n=1 Tax=Streptomyces enissocaesilis TaxID=332589 RepID=UPI0031DE2391